MRDGFFESIFDENTARMGTPSPSESKEAFIATIADGVRSGRIPRRAVTVEDAARLEWLDHIEPLRDRRRRGLKKVIEYLRDSLLYGSDGANIDPLLSQAYPLGDGTDKTLSAWTPTDYQNASLSRQKVAMDQVASADEFDAVVAEFVSVMESRGAGSTGAMFDGTGAGEAVA